MAGFWHLSHHQIRDLNGAAYAGARAFFYEAASLDPITVYQDYGLGTPHANPVVANAYGIFPPVFLDEEDGFYRQRITTADGVIIAGMDVGTLPIIGPAVGEGGGVEVPVDANALAQTGDVKWRPSTATIDGWVRMNGRQIGSATSGATERANADAEALYLHLWNSFSDSICAVGGGRGASAAADWAANKIITLPSMRGRSPFGVTDMGNVSSGEIDATYVTLGGPTTGGSLGGGDDDFIGRTALPNVPLAVSGQVTPTASGGQSALVIPGGSSTIDFITGTGSAPVAFYRASAFANVATVNLSNGITASMNGGVSQTPFNKMPPFMLGVWFMRL